MSEESGNRVVVTENERVRRIRTDKEIVDENKQLEETFKAKTKTQEAEPMTTMLVEQQDRSINFGVVGLGQAGGKIAEEFYKRGYATLAVNTATQDLDPLDIPERHKLFLDYALGGAGKDLDSGAAAVEENADEILKHLESSFEGNEVLMLCCSGAGGTGSGGAENMIKLMTALDKPVSVIYILPTSSEDALAKHNSIQTLARLGQMAKDDVISSLIVVDNAKIESLYPGKSMAEFWKTANEAIVEPLHLFNKLSSTPSEYTSLDAMDFSRVVIGTSDCLLYGFIDVEDYLEEDAIAEAIIENLENGLLASEFDLKQARSAGIIITASKEILSSIPAANIEYGFAMALKVAADSTQQFRGVYEVEGQDYLRVYSMFAGLGLPEERVNELRMEAEKHMQALQDKEDNRASNMTVDIGKTKAVSAADALHKKIKGKKSAMGKIRRNSKKVNDKRRR